MCGIFGAFTVAPGAVIVPQHVVDIAALVEVRGDHATGIARLGDPLAPVEQWKAPGAARAHWETIAHCANGASAVIGHCRWATHGDVKDNRNNHPHSIPHVPFVVSSKGREHVVHVSGALVHNGVASNYADVAKKHDLRLESECDSEAIALYLPIPFASMKPHEAIQSTVDTFPGSMACAALFPRRIFLWAAGNPVSFVEADGVVYFASEGRQLEPVMRKHPKVSAVNASWQFRFWSWSAEKGAFLRRARTDIRRPASKTTSPTWEDFQRSASRSRDWDSVPWRETKPEPKPRSRIALTAAGCETPDLLGRQCWLQMPSRSSVLGTIIGVDEADATAIFKSGEDKLRVPLESLLPVASLPGEGLRYAEVLASRASAIASRTETTRTSFRQTAGKSRKQSPKSVSDQVLRRGAEDLGEY